MNEGHINIFRKIVDWKWYKKQNTKDLFIHYLLKANWRDGWFEGELIKRGSFATSRKRIFEETSISIQSQRTAEQQLQSTNDITLKSTNKYIVITVVNYDKYQVLEKKSTINQQTTNKQLTTIEEYKELNNNKKENTKRKKYGEYLQVLLTEEEYQKLVSEYGSSLAETLITYLDEYIEMKGYKAKNHYLCIKKWVIKAVKEKTSKKATTPNWVGKEFETDTNPEKIKRMEEILKEYKN